MNLVELKPTHVKAAGEDTAIPARPTAASRASAGHPLAPPARASCKVPAWGDRHVRPGAPGPRLPFTAVRAGLRRASVPAPGCLGRAGAYEQGCPPCGWEPLPCSAPAPSPGKAFYLFGGRHNSSHPEASPVSGESTAQDMLLPCPVPPGPSPPPGHRIRALRPDAPPSLAASATASILIRFTGAANTQEGVNQFSRDLGAAAFRAASTCPPVFGHSVPLPIHEVSAGISKSLSFTYVGENV